MHIETHDTPAERRRLKVRELILSAAENVFADEGEEGLSIRRLARNVDYSPAAIYKYFGSKDELVFELKEAFFARILNSVHRMVDAHCPFSDRARSCVATYVRIAVEKPYHYAAAFAGQVTDIAPEDWQPEFENSNKGLAFLVLKGMVEEGVDMGHFRADLDPSLAAKSIWASSHGLAMMMNHIPGFPMSKHDTDTMSADAFIVFHADNIIRGLEV